MVETPVTPQSARHAELIERIGKNLEEYHASLMNFDKRELIEMAGRIHAMSDAYSYLCDGGFEDGELDFLLQFKNPLEIVAEGWLDHNIDIDDVMGFAFADVMRHKEDWLASYPLVDGAAGLTDNGPRRFMDVSFPEFLGGIMPNASVSVEESHEWLRVEDELGAAAESDDPYDKRLMLLVGPTGGVLLHERDVFIKDSEPFNAVVSRAADPETKVYFIEAARLDGETARLNVFEGGGITEYVKRLHEIALPCDSVFLYYGIADTLWVKHNEHRQAPDKYKTYRGQPLRYSYYLPENMREMDRLMNAEMSRRMDYPIGDMKTGINSISEITVETPSPFEMPGSGRTSEPDATKPTPAASKKPSISDKLRTGKEKAEATRAKNPAATTKKREKEID